MSPTSSLPCPASCGAFSCRVRLRDGAAGSRPRCAAAAAATGCREATGGFEAFDGDGHADAGLWLHAIGGPSEVHLRLKGLPDLPMLRRRCWGRSRLIAKEQAMIKHSQVAGPPIGRSFVANFAIIAVTACAVTGLPIVAAKASSVGWQAPSTLSIPAGRTSQFVGEQCKAPADVVWNGAFAMNSVGQSSNVSLGFNGPRIDENPPDFSSWGWHFFWPNGAPAGVTITFSVLCQKIE